MAETALLSWLEVQEQCAAHAWLAEQSVLLAGLGMPAGLQPLEQHVLAAEVALAAGLAPLAELALLVEPETIAELWKQCR